MGNKVTCVDIDKIKIENLNKGVLPIYEPGLDAMVLENQKKGTFEFTTSVESALKNTNICFIAVGTPMGQEGSADLQYVQEMAKNIGTYMHEELIVVDKSTVPVGTADKVRKTIKKELYKRSVKTQRRISRRCTRINANVHDSGLPSPFSGFPFLAGLVLNRKLMI